MLGWFVSSGEYAITGHPCVVGDGSFSQFCKICGFSKDSTRTLICDTFEESFHMSCCSPKIKLVPVQDEWHCQYCKKEEEEKIKEVPYEDKADIF